MTSLLDGCFVRYASAVRARFASLVPDRQEDPLHQPVGWLVAVGKAQGSAMLARDESPLARIGRPDHAVSANCLLCGHIEFKLPGTATDPRRFKGHNKHPWEKAKRMPIITCTDNNGWALSRTDQLMLRPKSHSEKHRLRTAANMCWTSVIQGIQP